MLYVQLAELFEHWNVTVLFPWVPSPRLKEEPDISTPTKKEDKEKQSHESNMKLSTVDKVLTAAAACRRACRTWSPEGRVLRPAGRWGGTTVWWWRLPRRRCPRFLWKHYERYEVRQPNQAQVLPLPRRSRAFSTGGFRHQNPELSPFWVFFSAEACEAM